MSGFRSCLRESSGLPRLGVEADVVAHGVAIGACSQGRSSTQSNSLLPFLAPYAVHYPPSTCSVSEGRSLRRHPRDVRAAHLRPPQAVALGGGGPGAAPGGRPRGQPHRVQLRGQRLREGRPLAPRPPPPVGRAGLCPRAGRDQLQHGGRSPRACC